MLGLETKKHHAVSHSGGYACNYVVVGKHNMFESYPQHFHGNDGPQLHDVLSDSGTTTGSLRKIFSIFTFLAMDFHLCACE